MRQNLSSLFRLLALVVLLAGMATVASAQFKAGLQGSVTDENGASVPDATVTLTNKETNRSIKTTSGDDGFYRFSSLAPGLYSVTVEKQGFKKQVIDNLNIRAEALEGLNVALAAGAIAETITVTANEVTVQSEDANIRRTITTEEILALPQVGRNPYELARLTPGVFGTGARSADGGGTRLPNTSGPGASNNSIFATEDRQPISANGQRVSANNLTIDGSSVNSQTWGGGAVITPSQESVKEVQVTATTYSAEDGRNSGAQIKVISKNGTNQWSGSAFLKVNDPALNAFNQLPRDIGGGPARVEQKFNTFGGSFGGPIIKDKLFFFFTYEGLRSNTNNTYQSWVETASYRTSVLAARGNTVTGRILNSPGVAPRVVQVLTPNCAELNGEQVNGCAIVGNGMDLGRLTGAFGTYVQWFNTNSAPTGGGFDGVADFQKVLLENPTRFSGNQYNTRLDYNMTEKDTLTFSSYFVPNSATSADTAAQSRPMADITSDRLSYALGFIYRRQISATTVNEARFNITRWGFDETQSNPELDFGLPRIEIESVFSGRLRFGAPYGLNTPGIINERQLEFRNTYTTLIGNHALKIGGEYRRDINSNGEVGGARPLYSFKGLWNFANGTPIFQQIVADQQGRPTPNNTVFHTGNLGLFVQDDWKIRPNLTVNMGLRWEWFTPITANDGGVIGNLLLGPNGGLTGARITTRKQLTNNNLSNFGPQLGFAWSPDWLGAGKLVIRGGGGIGYDRLPNALLANARRNPPNGSIFGICCGTNGTTDGFGTPFVGGLISYVSSSTGILGYPANPLLGGGTNPTTGLPQNGAIEIYGTPQDLPDATVYRYSLEGQYQLPGNMIATVGFQGSQGRKFVRILPIHITAPGANPNVFAAFFASADVNSNYNAMITRLQGRLVRSLSFDMNYRWAKAIDTASFESPCACTNQSFPVDQRQERGPSDFDVRHSFVASSVFDVPVFTDRSKLSGKLLGGWQISSIWTWTGGFPWTPKIFGCLQAANTPAGFCDLRPTSFNGTQPASNTNANFLRPGGIFGVAGTQIFGTATNTNNPFANLPAIGRNRLRGPRYFNTDMAISKRFGLGDWGFLGERAMVDVRFNFFNIFNTLNLAPFDSNSDPTRVQLPTFGRAIAGLAGRVGEFQLRFSF